MPGYCEGIEIVEIFYGFRGGCLAGFLMHLVIRLLDRRCFFRHSGICTTIAEDLSEVFCGQAFAGIGIFLDSNGWP